LKIEWEEKTGQKGNQLFVHRCRPEREADKKVIKHQHLKAESTTECAMNLRQKKWMIIFPSHLTAFEVIAIFDVALAALKIF
jgi:hypothetical protein